MIYSRFVLQGCCFAAIIGSIAAATAQNQSPDQLWQKSTTTTTLAKTALPRTNVWVEPQTFVALTLDAVAMRSALAAAPVENLSTAAPALATTKTTPAQKIISLPMPDGSFQNFAVTESSVMDPALAAQFPEIKTYFAQGLDDPAATARLDFTPQGFHAQILSPNGAVYIDPHFRDASEYVCYAKKDYLRSVSDFHCGTLPRAVKTSTTASRTAARSGGNLRTYRLAVAATGEYTTIQANPNPPTIAIGQAAIVTAVNRVSGVYETELAIRLVLVANNSLLVYTNSSTDPYSNGNSNSLLTKNQANIDTIIGTANYDIGHVFSTAGGGLAGLGVVCNPLRKAEGETGSSAPTGDSFWIDYVAHEMGHQFGGDHTFNSSLGSCSGNGEPTTAYEPGSGTTIMAYAGICGADDLQAHSDPYFHSASFDQIVTYSVTNSTGSSCGTVNSTGNTAPTVNAGASYTIPASTPFTLTASGSDVNGDTLTYCWEERDLGPIVTVSAADNGSSPIFRSFSPTTNTSRTFPLLSNILNNTVSVGEKLPTTSRTMNFRVTARDNRAGGGGVNTADTSVTSVSTAGPFAITSHNTRVTNSGVATVTWNVANSASAPISCANVKISLSTNGGLAFPFVLTNSTPNTGIAIVTLPSLSANTSCRLKIEAVGNIFFAINSTNFTLQPSGSYVSANLVSATLINETCSPTNGVLDAGENVTLNFTLNNTGNKPTTNLVATLLPTGGVAVPSAPQNYGVLSTNGTTVTRQFSFAVTDACGSTVTATLQLQDGTNNLGTVSNNKPVGQLATAFAQSFDGVIAPALPSGWTTIGGGGQIAWFSRTITNDTVPNAMFSTNSAIVGTNEFVSPAFTLGNGGSQLTFRHNYNLESGYDGGVLEIKIGAGGWTDIVTAGGSFVTGGYNSTLSTSYSNPLGGRAAWSGASGGFITTTVNLPTNTASQFVQFRWRCGTDSSTGGAGWYVDTFNISSPACCLGSPVITAFAHISTTEVNLMWQCATGVTYRVQYKTNLLQPAWLDFTTNIVANSSTIATNLPLVGNQRFYRVSALP